MKTIQLPKLTGYQRVVWDWLGDCKGTGKIAVIKSVRQSGKSFFCQMKLIEQSFLHVGTSAIFEPTLTQARVMYKAIEGFFNGSNLIKSANAQLLEIEFVNGSVIYFKSTEQSARSFTVTNLLILDECAYLKEDEIFTILPLVNAHNAPILICSTPFTEDGYYYDMYLLGLNGENENVKTFDWAKEKEVERFLTPERKRFYKQTMSPQKYRTECEGEFLTGDGLLFVGMDKCVLKQTTNNKILYIGIDFATGSDGDYTVLTAVNGDGNVYKYWRTNNLTPSTQVEWLARIIIALKNEGYTIQTILGEVNSIGSVYKDYLNKELQPTGLCITEWVTTNESKQKLVTTLQIAFEQGQIGILDDEIVLNELRKYQASINPNTKKVSYNGAKGHHDDTVISLMLAYYAYKKALGQFTIKFV